MHFFAAACIPWDTNQSILLLVFVIIIFLSTFKDEKNGLLNPQGVLIMVSFNNNNMQLASRRIPKPFQITKE